MTENNEIEIGTTTTSTDAETQLGQNVDVLPFDIEEISGAGQSWNHNQSEASD